MRRLLLLLSSSFVFFPHLTPAQSQLTRDPQALKLLSAMHAAMGGNVLATVQDTVATADLKSTRQGSAVTETLTIKTYGRYGVRAETQTGVGLRLFVIDARRVSVRDAAGVTRNHSRRSLGSIGAPHLPLLSLIGDLANGSFKIEYVGLERSDRSDLHRVRLHEALDPKEGFGEFDAPVDVWIEQGTHLPAKVRYFHRPPDNLQLLLPIEIRLSDYRLINGIVVPFKVEQFMGDTLAAKYTIVSFAVNQGVNPSEFEVR